MDVVVVDDEDVPEPTLQNVLDQKTLKWVFVGGKGGVGKTTCSASLAVLLASVRQKVLIISTDPAHNLSDAFRQKFSRNPVPVDGFTNLFAMEVDPTVEVDSLEEMGNAAGIAGLANDSLVQELAGSIPGIDEAMSFAEVLKLVKSLDYDIIVFDTAPTGHTLRLLQLPSVLDRGLGRLLQLKNKFGGMINQVSRLVGAPDEMGAEAVVSRLEGLRAVIEDINTQFQNPDLTTFVCVCIPEFLSLYETERLVQELARFRIDVRNIVINQVLFAEEVSDSPLLKARIRMQQKYIDQFHDLYEDFHITKLPLLPDEVRGAGALQEFSKNLVKPYRPEVLPAGQASSDLEAEVVRLRSRVEELEAELATYKKGKEGAGS